jgi:hypothetical protein
MQYREFGKFGRHKHATFDMNMAIYKARHDIGQRRINRLATSFNKLNMAVLDPKGCPVDMLIGDVYYIAGNGIGLGATHKGTKVQ